MQIPPPLLPPLATGETEETRRHLSLETKTGSIDADISLVDRGTAQRLIHKTGRITMEVKTHAAGSITVKLVRRVYPLFNHTLLSCLSF